MKKPFLPLLLSISLIGNLSAQKPKDIRKNNTSSSTAPKAELPTMSDFHKSGVPTVSRVFEATSNPIKSIPVLPHPSSSLPKGIKVLSTEGGVATLIKGSIATNALKEAPLSTRAIQYLDAVKSAMKINNPSEEFEVKNIETDELGQSHVRMQQKLGNIPVWGSEIIVHERKGVIEQMNGVYFPTPQLGNTPSVSSLEPTVSEPNALKTVQTDLSTKTNYSILSSDAVERIGGQQFSSELVIFHVGEKKDGEKLAWHISAYPNVLHRYEYFVDAQNGQILDSYTSSCDLLGHLHLDKKEPHHTATSTAELPVEQNITEGVPTAAPIMMDGKITSTGNDLQNLSRTFGTYQVGTTYYLIDASKSMFNSTASVMPSKPVGAIQTFDYKNTDDGPAYYVSSTNNSWTSSAKAVSAHYNAGKTFDYFKTVHGRNSINNKGNNISSYINVTDNAVQMDNAYWNGEAMFYGNGKDFFSALPKALDVAGHEISHGVIQNSANLTYQGESGALNESFADIFGAMIDRSNWQIGEDVIIDKTTFPTGALRDLSNPHNGGTKLGNASYQPQTYSERYTGTQDNGGVHINSGIVNYAFYLIASNAAVGKDKAEKIYYRALTTYLVKSSKFIDLRAAIEQSCKDLYPTDTNLLAIAQNAFTQVGIGSGGTTTGTTYQKDLDINQGSDYIVYVSADGTKLQLTNGTGSSTITLWSKGVLSRPSVTDDGSAILFIGADKKMYAVTIDWAKNTFDTMTIEGHPYWNNVAISKDGNKLVGNFDDKDNTIWVYSFELQKGNTFTLYNPTTASNNTNSNDVQYSDALEWDHYGENVMYDAYNLIPGAANQGADVSYWDIGFINVWSNAAKNFTSGNVEKLFSDLGENTSVGNPTFAKNSPYIVAFDYIESSGTTDSYYVLAANTQTGDVTASGSGIFSNNTLGVPSFSRTDKVLLFTTEDAASTNQVKTIPLATNKIDASSTATTTIKTAAQKGNWFANGKRVIVNATNDLDKTMVSIAPNPFTDFISLEVAAENAGEGRIDMYDLLGRKVATQPLSITQGKNAVSIPTTQLQAGAYLLKITISGKSLTTKVMKL